MSKSQLRNPSQSQKLQSKKLQLFKTNLMRPSRPQLQLRRPLQLPRAKKPEVDAAEDVDQDQIEAPEVTSEAIEEPSVEREELTVEREALTEAKEEHTEAKEE